jgi:3-phosphoshikimate 1-carboxyvinyltransferase
LSQDADILIENVGINPTRTGVIDILKGMGANLALENRRSLGQETRTGVIDILKGMGANLALENRRSLGQEPVADLRVRASRLQGGPVDPALVPLAIDEFPALFVAAAAAKGKTSFSGLEELSRGKGQDKLFRTRGTEGQGE